MNELNLSDEAILKRLKKCIRKLLGADDQNREINLSDNLKDDLNLDSLDGVELVVDIKKEFGVDIGDDLEAFSTVDDVFRHLKMTLGSDSE